MVLENELTIKKIILDFFAIFFYSAVQYVLEYGNFHFTAALYFVTPDGNSTLSHKIDVNFGFCTVKNMDNHMWHIISKGPIWSKWSYCQGRVVWAINKHLRPIPSPTVENSQRNRH